MILNIKNLNIGINNQKIINNFNLKINQNEIHFIFGPNGSGKSTLLKVLAGHPNYTVSSGKITFENTNILKLSTEKRAQKGIFLAFQHPLEIPGITNYDFLYLLYTEHQKYNKLSLPSHFDFLLKIKKYLKRLNFNEAFLFRELNYGFSGGEKKKNEILQLLLLQPKLILLDEFDSGLDIDSLKLISKILRNEFYFKTSFLIVTHNIKILKYFTPTFIHILKNGKITKTGSTSLINELEFKGYTNYN